MDDILVRARAHDWWYSDRNIATLLMDEVETLRARLANKDALLDALGISDRSVDDFESWRREMLDIKDYEVGKGIG